MTAISETGSTAVDDVVPIEATTHAGTRSLRPIRGDEAVELVRAERERGVGRHMTEMIKTITGELDRLVHRRVGLGGRVNRETGSAGREAVLSSGKPRRTFARREQRDERGGRCSILNDAGE